MTMRRPLCPAAAILALAACSSPPAPDLCGGNGCGSERTIENSFQTTMNLDLDLLFIVDDTGAAALSAADLAAASQAWTQVLATPVGLSLHAGAVSATLCGALPAWRGAACGLPASVAYAISQGCGRGDNFAGPLDGELACLVDLGTSGCPPVQPLEAMRRLLASNTLAWQGFLRPNAYLAIVIVAAEDDASGMPVSAFADTLRSLRVDPANQILVSVVGPSDGAVAAPRLFELTQDFGRNGLYQTIGSAGLAHAIDALGIMIDILVDPLCLDGVRDTDPATPGVQADCVVEDTVIPTGGTPTKTVLASCDVASPPCWRIEAGSPGCGGRFGFTVDRGPDFCPTMSTRTRLECLGCLDAADPACAGR